MWLAFVIVLGVNGAIYTSNAPTPYPTKDDCVAANVAVEDKLMKNAEASKEVFAYHFDCVEVTDKTFKKPGLDV